MINDNGNSDLEYTFRYWKEKAEKLETSVRRQEAQLLKVGNLRRELLDQSHQCKWECAEAIGEKLDDILEVIIC